MDERSPRQPDSSGPPEESDETAARAPRPENPYRIPQRPPGPARTDTGGFGGYGPSAPAAPAHDAPRDQSAPAGGESSSGGGTWGGPRHGAGTRGSSDSWDTPGRPWEDPAASRENPGGSWGAPDTSSGTPQDSWDTSRGSWDAPGQPWSASDEPRETPNDSWGAPRDSRDAPVESWETPRDPWDAPRDTSDTPGNSWDADRAGQAPSEDWDTPYPSAQGPSGGWSGTGSEAPVPDPWQEAPDQDSWQEAPGQDRQSAAEAGTRDWDRPGPEVPSGHGEAWDEGPRQDDPYHGEPYQWGDTPYPGTPSYPDPGAASHPREAPHEQEPRYSHEAPEDGAAPGQRPREDYAYLYHGDSGPGGPDDPDHPEDDYYDDAPPPRRASRRGLVIGLVSAVVVLLLVGGAASWYVLTLPQPEETTAEYEAAWEAQDYDRLAAVTTGGDAAGVMSGIDAGLGVESIDVEITAPSTEGGSGSASYEVTVDLANAGDWGWEGELPLVREDGEWWVDFSPEVAYPGLGEGQVLVRTTVWGERGRILAADGTRLDTPDVSGSLQMIVGSLGEATEEDVERLGPAYSVGDTVGVGGLQSTYEERLAGEAATTILMVDAAQAEDPDSLEATEENTVASLDGSDGEDIVTSIDMAVHNAAANAIIDSAKPAGMVAVRASTGEVLAAVNVPGGFNRAFEGQYEPGSTLKVVSYSALLDSGMTMDTVMDCPKEFDPGGWNFRNAGGAEYGAQSVTEAFATSCNTALVQQVVDRLSPDALRASAEQFGMNAPLDIGVPTFEPSFPTPDGNVLLGAQSIGQGQVLTSPLHMATVPAAVADGSWRHPVLVTDPVREGLPEPRAVANADALRTMMRAVVTEGTAKDVPFQGEVYGKTGTAEYGTAEDADENGELPSHAWMIGFKGDVAFAVVVEGGGGGSAVAAPLAAKFTNAL
ncbi:MULTISPECIES: penicillin-binding transpeptidase domain-containing protein [unclassified Nocardiopsis]|uniref:penicillin-binding transpeptidase domain-containing protein n=1 Tax=unclassified Nocardiopsis TaxID=2649073 RepID=UPI001F270BEE|nr:MULTISPECIES: penicillin-binding transpeptidase domain-containing protein [unclassified Nocardiopsis]